MYRSIGAFLIKQLLLCLVLLCLSFKSRVQPVARRKTWQSPGPLKTNKKTAEIVNFKTPCWHPRSPGSGEGALVAEAFVNLRAA